MVETALAVTAASALFGGYTAYEGSRRAGEESDAQKKLVAQREKELADEAAAKTAAEAKAATSGRRAGAQGSLRSSFTASAAAGGTGFNNVAEDNIRRGTLFGN